MSAATLGRTPGHLNLNRQLLFGGIMYRCSFGEVIIPCISLIIVMTMTRMGPLLRHLRLDYQNGVDGPGFEILFHGGPSTRVICRPTNGTASSVERDFCCGSKRSLSRDPRNPQIIAPKYAGYLAIVESPSTSDWSENPPKDKPCPRVSLP